MSVVNKPLTRKSSKTIPNGVGAVRRIRHTLSLGGNVITNVKSVSKDELNYSAGSTASATFQDNSEDWLAISQQHNPLPFIITTTVAYDDVIVFQAAEEFSGVVDTIDLDEKTSSFTVHASSYGRVLVSEKVSETFAGTTTAPLFTGTLVQRVVAKYGKGLKVYVSPKFLAKPHTVGRIYKANMVKSLRNIPVWDLIQSLAQKDGADCYVKGDTLYYVERSPEATDDITQLGDVPVAYTFTYGVNLLDVSVQHSPLFAHDISVTVRSYQPRTQQTFESTKNMSDVQIKAIVKKLEITNSRDEFDNMNAASLAKMKRKPAKDSVSGSAQPARIGKKQNYTFVVPNSTQEDCERIAETIARDISAKEFIITIKVLCQPDFNCRQFFALAEMPTPGVNISYAPKSIHMTSGVEAGGSASGYIATIVMVNHAVQTTGASLGQ
jgi:hypothetical protein